MSATLMAIVGLGAMFLGYRFYSKFIAEKIYRLDPKFETPAHTMRDNVDYLPTRRVVLWGHHFTTVAGASPIVGPGIAVIWGWLPALIWVTVGTVFLAGVHDFGAIWASVRNRGRSMGALTGDIVSRRSRSLFMIVIFLLLLMVNAVFAVVISTAFVATPSSVIPTWASLPVAIGIGVLIYKLGVGLFWPTAIGTVMLYAAIFLGSVMPVSLPAEVFGLQPSVQWILILFLYCGIASLLPVWMLLQPRDFINGIQLFVGLGLMYGAVFLARPAIVAPAINFNVPAGAPPIVPLLFVTIACGAISGFHGLVGSGTTSKQLDKEPDARFVGYLGALGEGSLALVTIIAATAGFATLSDWESMYSSFGQGGVLAFVTGGASILNQGFGLSVPFASTLLTVMAVLFAATTMDSAVRLQRYIIQEWGAIYHLPLLQNAYAATLLAVGTCLMLVFGAGGSTGTGGMVLWPLFGTTNQLLAGLTLLVISVMLVKLGRPSRYTLVPMIFVTCVSLLAALYQLWSLYAGRQYLLLVVDVMIIVAALFVTLEAASALMRERQAAGPTVTSRHELARPPVD
jgi:carbon starvation protein